MSSFLIQMPGRIGKNFEKTNVCSLKFLWKFESNREHVNYLLEKSTGSETDVFPPKLFTFDLRLECLILRWPLIGFFQKQHLSRQKG